MASVTELVQQLRLEHPDLLMARRLWSREEILATSTPVPAAPGVYAWYFERLPHGVPTADLVSFGGLTLLYIGISPKAPPTNSRPPSRQTLRTRLRYHMRGNAEGSTLRLTLGCLLSAELGLQLRRVGSDHRLTFGDGEARLSAWLADNARVTWEICSEPWLLEKELFNRVPLPLNLDGNSHAFCRILSELRRTARDAARQLPIWQAK
jgi:hypothetical protein